MELILFTYEGRIVTISLRESIPEFLSPVESSMKEKREKRKTCKQPCGPAECKLNVS